MPEAIFNDPDSLIDINENLSYELIGSDELFKDDLNEYSIFKFDKENLSFSGSTKNLGLDKINGSGMWKNKLIAKDNYGESISIDLIFSSKNCFVTFN